MTCCFYNLSEFFLYVKLMQLPSNSEKSLQIYLSSPGEVLFSEASVGPSLVSMRKVRASSTDILKLKLKGEFSKV